LADATTASPYLIAGIARQDARQLARDVLAATEVVETTVAVRPAIGVLVLRFTAAGHHRLRAWNAGFATAVRRAVDARRAAPKLSVVQIRMRIGAAERRLGVGAA
jgi:hypothetical protein